MICISTSSTSFSHYNGHTSPALSSQNADLSVTTYLSFSSSTTIYLLGYSAVAGTVDNGKLIAIKI